MRVADLLVRCLENEGVEYVFGVPGEEMLDILDAIVDSKIRFVSTRHEQGAAFMADTIGRLTGHAGVAISTLGPGAMNLATGIADAHLDHAPLVAITGQIGLEATHKESHQYIDTTEIYRPITKWSTRIDTPDITSEVVRKAFKTAEAEKPGACHIEVPEDIAAQDVEGEPISRRSVVPQSPRPEAVRLAANLINHAERPIILSGNGVIRGRASAELRAFAEKTNIAVANTFMGKGAISATSDLSVSTIGLQARDHVSCGFDRADLVIAVGYDLVEYSPRRWNPDHDKTIVHIDFTPSEVDESYVPAAEVVGDVASSLRELTRLVHERDKCDYFDKLRGFIVGEMESHANDKNYPVAPQKLIYDLRQALASTDILISDVGAHKLWIARMYPTYEPNTVLMSNGLAAMGFALPAAIAAKLVMPDRKVVAACGDGGFLMNAQEMETAVRLQLPIVAVIFNDFGYGLIRWKQMGKYHRECGVSFGNPDFVKFAESFGAKGYRPRDASETLPALQEALRQDVPAIVDVRVDYSENFRLSERLGQMICPT
ncbi:MAG: acetolactate synthase large subunit [Armatimonadota bacterium]|nr:acetolactate synthase large subunit [Armatimonadota bacterium]